jgi:hypothetical protein
MRKLFGAGIALIALVGCGSSGRALEGKAPADVTDIYAIDSQGRTAHADTATGDFHVDLAPGASDVLFVALADGTIAPLVFDANADGARQSRIPDFTGTVQLGQLTLVDLSGQRNGEGTEEAESEENPLDAIDSDDDGEADFADGDDDDDGQEDGDDADSDGNGDDDDDEDLDSDDDGSPDEADSDDDNDGTDDADDDDGEEDDDDGEEGDDDGEDTD